MFLRVALGIFMFLIVLYFLISLSKLVATIKHRKSREGVERKNVVVSSTESEQVDDDAATNNDKSINKEV